MGTILRAIAGYFFLLLTVRVLIRRPGAQMTLFEFVFVFLVGGVVIAATVHGDRSMVNCTTAVITIGLMHRTVSYFKWRYPRLASLVDGLPLVVLRNGEWQQRPMGKLHLAPEDVMAASRSKGNPDFAKIQHAVLERNGAITVIQKKDE